MASEEEEESSSDEEDGFGPKKKAVDDDPVARKYKITKTKTKTKKIEICRKSIFFFTQPIVTFKLFMCFNEFYTCLLLRGQGRSGKGPSK